MLTAIRNIWIFISNYDEHRFGREESMESSMYHKRFCYECGATWRTDLKSVGDKLLCEFCRLGNSTPRISLGTRIRGAISRLTARRGNKISQFLGCQRPSLGIRPRSQDKADRPSA